MAGSLRLFAGIQLPLLAQQRQLLPFLGDQQEWLDSHLLWSGLISIGLCLGALLSLLLGLWFSSRWVAFPPSPERSLRVPVAGGLLDISGWRQQGAE